MYGFPSQRHLLKVDPFLYRLDAAQGGLMKALQSGDPLKVGRGIDDVSFWVGRSVAEMISASEAGDQNPKLFMDGLKTLMKAQYVIVQAKKWLASIGKNQWVDPSHPFDVLSPLGEIIKPLEVKPSKIAGEGLFTKVSIPKGTIISLCRLHVNDTGKFIEDIKTTRTAAKTNHSPFPNVDIVRGKAPQIEPLHNYYPKIQGGSYLVANRDIQAGEELTANYKDEKWNEFLCFTDLQKMIPFERYNSKIYNLILTGE